MPPRVRGWDHGIYTVLGTAIGAGKLIGLTREQLAEAASLAVSPNVPTRQARAGDLTMWKGCATAAATRSGVFAAYLAQDGMRGPSEPFTGTHGIADNVAPDRSARPSYGGEGRPFHIGLAHLKSVSVEYHLQAPALAAIQLRKKVDPRDITRLSIATYKDAYTETGMEPEKWRPTTRETADHSMPYVVAVALIDGEISPRSFAPDRIADPAVHELMDKISVTEDPAITAEFPSTMRSDMEVVTATSVLPWETDRFPKGHVLAPMSRDEIEAKFLSQAVPVLGSAAGQELLSSLWRLREADSIGPVMGLLSANADRRI
jgi:2-methylcitrate dehydratase